MEDIVAKNNARYLKESCEAQKTCDGCPFSYNEPYDLRLCKLNIPRLWEIDDDG